ncbi:MAG: hypothetical protein AAB557_00195 [Patescibacteria group bacterium]
MTQTTTVYFPRKFQPDGAVVRTAKAIPDELTIQGNDGEDRMFDGVSIISPGGTHYFDAETGHLFILDEDGVWKLFPDKPFVREMEWR